MKKFITTALATVVIGSACAATYMLVNQGDISFCFDIEDVLRTDIVKDTKWNLQITRKDSTIKSLSLSECTGISIDTTLHMMEMANAEDGNTYVDLGLKSGLLWAAFNVGATKPEEFGNYYAWAETETKDTYSWDNYKFGSRKELNKYCNSTFYGTIDTLTVMTDTDDVATTLWGELWRLPYESEVRELRESCIWRIVDNYNNTGISGLLGISKYNGNTIFFPSAGYFYNSKNEYINKSAHYWLKDLGSLYCTSGQYYYWMDYAMSVSGEDRSHGNSVRAVSNKIKLDAFTVNFFTPDSILINRQKIKVGADATLPTAVQAPEGYEFAGWSHDGKNIQRNTNIYARYQAVGAHGVSISGKLDHSNYVDLGLESGNLWATYNVGATMPEEFGHYFSWGEIEPNNLPSYKQGWENYKFQTKGYKTSYGLTKYTIDDKKFDASDPTKCGVWYDAEGKFIGDSLTELLPEDDAVVQNWGKNWHMPTRTEYEELIEACDWKVVKNFNNTSVWGLMGTSKTNGNTIFFPSDDTFNAYYYTASLSSTSEYVTLFSISYDKNTMERNWCYRFAREMVRAVSNVKIEGFTVEFYRADSTLYQTQKVVAGEAALEVEAPAIDDYIFTGWSEDLSNITKDVKVYAQYERDPGVTVSGITDGYAYVDLGLSVKWATYNVGAKLPWEKGDYFAFGEVEAKSEYSWDNYKWGGDTNGKITKYNCMSSIASHDNLNTLLPEDDAATVNRNDSWRMPTFSELYELLYNCQWTWTSNFNNSGVSGNIGKSLKNGNTIFLPSTGYRRGSYVVNANKGYFWTASVNNTIAVQAHYGVIDSEGVNYLNDYRYFGYTVRPVLK